MFRGLRWRLVLLISVALAPAIAYMVMDRLERRDRSQAELRAQTLNLARLAAQEQARRLEGARQLLIALGNSFRVEDTEACIRDVRALVNEYQDLYSEIGWADRSGRIRCHALEGDNLSIADRQYFQEALALDKFVVGEFIIGKISRTPIMAFSQPLRGADGNVIGVLFANPDLIMLGQSLQNPARESGGIISIVDRHGTIAARSSEAMAYIGTKIDDAELEAARRTGESVSSASAPDGGVRQFAIVALPGADGRPALYVKFERSEAPLLALTTARFQDDLVTIALLAVGMITAALVGAEWLVRRPVQHLLEATSGLGAGRLDTRAKGLGSTTEFAALAEGFNRMAAQLEQRDLHLREGQRLEAVGQMAGGIAHDFNNLLTIIACYGASLEEHLAGSREASAELAELRAAADKAAALTRQLLIFSRRQLLQPKRFEVNAVVLEMQTMLRRTIGGDIQLNVSLDERTGIVSADPTQIEQVIINLVINARDAMPGGGDIHIATRPVVMPADNVHHLPAGDYVQIDVTDTGIGMDADTRSRIFEPFFTTKGPHGTGLGLPTVYGIVTQSGGAVRCESAPGHGTRFEVLLPQVSGAPDPAAAPAPAPPASGSEHVLVVDDEPSMRALIASMLKRRGYAVSCAEDGLSALQRLRDTPGIRLVISDVRMPRMNGLALYEELQRSYPGISTILISGDSAPDVAHRDGDGPLFLQKPFTPAALLTVARAAVSRPA